MSTSTSPVSPVCTLHLRNEGSNALRKALPVAAQFQQVSRGHGKLPYSSISIGALKDALVSEAGL